MLVYGGWSYGAFVENVAEFSLQISLWMPDTVMTTPAARSRLASAQLNGGMVIFGGLTIDGPQNDAWLLRADPLFNMSGRADWQALTPLNFAAPPSRYGHSLSSLDFGTIILFGGHQGAFAAFLYYNDVWSATVPNPGVISWAQLAPNSSSSGSIVCLFAYLFILLC
jgi:hypothetical protein